MNVSGCIINGTIDAGIGLENVQCVELEEYCREQGRPTTDVRMLRIDVLAELGCCCFCSSSSRRSFLFRTIADVICAVLIIANEQFLAREPKKVAAFMRAVKKAADFMHAEPAAAWAEFCRSVYRTFSLTRTAN